MTGHKYTPEERIAAFWSKVDKSGGPDACWNWTGSFYPSGYGAVRWNGHTHLSHRLAYALSYGAIPQGMCVCHRCDNPPCCNPTHLWIGTKADNNADKMKKGRMVVARGSQNGQNTHPERTPRGELHVCAKLTDAQVDEIRELFAHGYTNKSRLGRQFGVSDTQINRIVTGKARRQS